MTTERYAQGSRPATRSFEVVALGFDGTLREVARGLTLKQARRLADALFNRTDVASVTATKGAAA